MKTVVLKFMSVFCGACGMHAQPTENFWDNLGPNGTDQVMVLGMEINAASDSSDCQNYINNYNITHPLIDNASSFGLGYSVTYTPTYYVVYPDYTYTPVCYQSCDYSTGPSTIEATLTNLVNDWTPQVNDLIISEYAEGISFNKYIEIYNGTAYDVDLSSYELWKITNGGTWPEQTQALNGIIESGETFVIAHSAADYLIISSADFTSSICSFNGNDAIGLAKFDGNDFILIDAVGSDGADPGDGWEVSSVPDATKDHTLIRQNSVCNPEINWNIGSTQWEVQAVNSWTNIGEHSGCLNTLPTVLGCTNPQANNYDPSANSDDGSCIVPSVEINNPSNSTVTSFNSITVQYLVNHFRVGTPDPLVNGHIHYFLDGVMQEFIDKTEGKTSMKRTNRHATKGRALGLGVMGWHTFLQKKNLPFRSFIIENRSEEVLGELFTFFILETILIGRFLDVNPFDQPAVEFIKKETKKILTNT